eukprot:15485850-Alexandrium_andersonii.AAC.1
MPPSRSTASAPPTASALICPSRSAPRATGGGVRLGRGKASRRDLRCPPCRDMASARLHAEPGTSSPAAATQYPRPAPSNPDSRGQAMAGAPGDTGT